MKLIIVRHGETVWNAEGKIQGQHHNSPFTKRGLRQIDQLGRKLAHTRVNVIYTSCLSRCIKTVEKVIEGKDDIPLHLDPRINQKNWGALEGMTRAEIGRKYPESGYGPTGESTDLNKKYHFRPPGSGESWYDVELRIQNFLKDIFIQHKPDETIMIVTHSAISRTILAKICGVSLWKIDRVIKHTRLQTFRVRRDKAGNYRIFNPWLMLRYKGTWSHTFVP